MRIAVLQTMYDEHENVLNNIEEVKSKFNDALFFVTHSFDKESLLLDKVKKNSYYMPLTNLGDSVEKLKLPALAITRNYSDLFNRFYRSNTVVDLIVALTGDTKIVDANSFSRRYSDIKIFGKKLLACQAKGQFFWSSNKVMDREQTDQIADFMPQLFFVDGVFASKSLVFNKINLTNTYTSEQCLGDEFLKHTTIDDIGRLNKDRTCWFDYNDGVVWQILTDGRPGRP